MDSDLLLKLKENLQQKKYLLKACNELLREKWWATHLTTLFEPKLEMVSYKLLEDDTLNIEKVRWNQGALSMLRCVIEPIDFIQGTRDLLKVEITKLEEQIANMTEVAEEEENDNV